MLLSDVQRALDVPRRHALALAGIDPPAGGMSPALAYLRVLHPNGLLPPPVYVSERLSEWQWDKHDLRSMYATLTNTRPRDAWQDDLFARMRTARWRTAMMDESPQARTARLQSRKIGPEPRRKARR